MPALMKTEHCARLDWIGCVGDRQAGLQSTPQEDAILGFEGLRGEAHSGLLRRSCARVTSLYPLGTEIRNTRQISLIDAAELAQIGAAIGVPVLAPELLGANMILSGLPDFSHLPPSARLLADNGTCLCIDMQNRPCILPAREIERAYPGKGAAFKAAAKGLRGLTAWVECPGALALGDRLTLYVPDQRAWQGFRNQ